jgi:diadenosine tetraphosphate (Ap4A) HIT family hydrolase
MGGTMNHDAQNCPFCRPEGILFENDLAYVKPDKFPVNPGHLLIIPKRHVTDYFLTTEKEKVALLLLLDRAKKYLDDNHAPAGYNVGINVGEAAGQTIAHVHMHLIPRYRGDLENPRGGVRGVIPSRQSY